MSQFKIIPAFKESAIIPFTNVKGILGSIGLMALCYAVLLAIMLGLFNFSFDPETIFNIEDAAAMPDVSAGAIFLGFIIIFMMFMIATGVLFNYWVRYAVYGPNGAINPDRGELIKSAIVNSLKFIVIGLLIVIVVGLLMGVLALVFGLFGLLDAEAIARGEQPPILIILNVIAIAIMCFIYSDMSKSLTKTAIGKAYVPPVDADRTDFAVVLMMIYLPLIFIAPIVTSLFGIWISFVVQAIIGLWVYFAIAAAHGVRHRQCAADDQQ